MRLLDAGLAAMMSKMAEAGAPPLWAMPHAAARAAFRIASPLAEAPAVPLALVEDRMVAGAAGPLNARVYDPAPGTARPALIYFHGGGFVVGDLDTHDRSCRRLAAESCIRVIAIDYRLAPEHAFPAPYEDALAAWAAIAAEPAAWGVDPARLAVGGDSAGGNLAIAVARTAAVKPAMQLLIYPWVQLVEEMPSMLAQAETALPAMRWFRDAYLRGGADPKDARISPLLAAPAADEPPALLVTAGHDPLIDEQQAYLAKLRAAGVSVDHHHYDDQIHGFVNYSAISKAAAPALAACAARLKAALS
jgi:acetyl esterase